MYYTIYNTYMYVFVMYVMHICSITQTFFKTNNRACMLNIELKNKINGIFVQNLLLLKTKKNVFNVKNVEILLTVCLNIIVKTRVLKITNIY